MGGVRVSRNCLRDRFKTTENTQRNYCEFWIDCRLCEMIAHGSSTVTIFLNKPKDKYKPFRRHFKFFGHQWLLHTGQGEDPRVFFRFLIFSFKQRQR